MSNGRSAGSLSTGTTYMLWSWASASHSVQAVQRQDRPALSQSHQQALAQLLRDHRTSLGLTQETVAERAGIATVHLQRLEASLGNPTLATMYALARALAVDVHTLIPDNQ